MAEDAAGVTCDVLVVGGGPAGLSAALILARACRSVVVCDDGHPRNARSGRIHGYLTRDGITPAEFRDLARGEMRRYGVRLHDEEVKRIARLESGFVAELASGLRLNSRRILIATGVVDRIPAIEGIDPLYGRSVHHCPYCDGWEWRGRSLSVLGKGSAAAGLSLSLLVWSRDVAICSDGPSRIAAADRGRLETHGIEIHEKRIQRLEGEAGLLRRIVFRDGSSLARDALFFSTGNHQACRIAVDLGCRIDRKGALGADRHERTNVPGVYAAGDASRDLQMVVVAAAEGAKAAVAINADLAKEELEAGTLAPASEAHRMR